MENDMWMKIYSWTIQKWLNIDASYDRIYFSSSFEKFDDLIETFKETRRRFVYSDKTRMVFNVKISPTLAQKIIDTPNLFEPAKIEFLCKHPNETILENSYNLIIWENKQERNLNWEVLRRIKFKVEDTLKKWNTQNLNDALLKIESLIDYWYSFSLNPKVSDLLILWEKTFWWDIDSICADLKTNDNLKMILKDKKWEVVCWALLTSDWESTEWATNDSFQKKWFIKLLLLVMHAYWINKMRAKWEILPIRAETRFDRSINPWISVWMVSSKINWILWIHQNHVTIWWSNPDSWNLWKQEINWVNYEELRSFITMFLKSEYYDHYLIQKILKCSKLIF